MTGRHLVLVGMMGAGKSTVGRECARRLGRPFVDTDEVVASVAGMPVAQVFATRGEPAFRELERAAVTDACAAPEPLVVACGGGAVNDPDSRRRLRAAGVVVWLRVPADVLARRVGDGSGRPLLAGDPAAALARLARLREPSYEAAADRVVDGAGPVGAVADAVIAAYEEAAVA